MPQYDHLTFLTSAHPTRMKDYLRAGILCGRGDTELNVDSEQDSEIVFPTFTETCLCQRKGMGKKNRRNC
jgi:hypothetical protein